MKEDETGCMYICMVIKGRGNMDMEIMDVKHS
jgi:hypothetical protein